MTDFLKHLADELTQLETRWLRKSERAILGPQAEKIETGRRPSSLDGHINLCSNNYLGLAIDPRLAQTAKAAIGRQGYGLVSVRFIYVTQDIHQTLKVRLASFLERKILHSAATPISSKPIKIY